MRLRIVECFLAVAATLVAYIVAEATFSLIGLQYVPLRLHADLPEDVRLFAQSSKFGVVPRNPVLLLGDSYAQGLGDWLLESDPSQNGSFHSAHIINKLTGHDVVTLGLAGAGSAEGIAALPATAFAHTKGAWYLRLPSPQVAVIYFYEGNDLNDNIRFLATRVENLDAPNLIERVDQSIAAYPSIFLVRRDWWRHFPLFHFSYRITQRIYAERASAKLTPAPTPAKVLSAQADQPNMVEVAGQPVELPANLQSPAMDLIHPEIERATLVFERSLAFLQKLLPSSPILVVYLPSPLSTYRLLSREVSIQRYVTNRATRYPREHVAEYSIAICRLIRAATIAHKAGFLDLRPAARTASARDVLHGPRDFKHFNRKGMEILGQAVAERINTPLVQDPC